MKLIKKTGKECDMPYTNQVEFCPHCGKMICPEIIRLMFPCEFCHNCGGKVEF
jgi:rRNA maturation protein Nop10